MADLGGELGSPTPVCILVTPVSATSAQGDVGPVTAEPPANTSPDSAGTSLATQWLRLHSSSAGGMALVPGRGTEIPHAVRHSQKPVNKQIFKFQAVLRTVEQGNRKDRRAGGPDCGTFMEVGGRKGGQGGGLSKLTREQRSDVRTCLEEQ